MMIMAPLTLARIPKRESEMPMRHVGDSFNWGHHVLMETRLLQKMRGSTQGQPARNAAPQKPVLIPAHLVPGHMKTSAHKKIKDSRLVVIGAGTE